MNMMIDFDDNYYDYIDEKYNYDNITKFNVAFSKYVGTKYCIDINTATIGLLTILLSLNISDGNVIIPSYGHNCGLNCLQTLNLNYKICNINYNTLCMDYKELKNTIDNKTKVVIFTNQTGYVGEDLIKIMNFCRSKNIILIEDASQGLGNKYKGKMAGTFGDIGIYSFTGPKLLRSGNGGCIVTNNTILYNEIVKIKKQFNFKLSPILCYYLIQQLDKIDTYLINKKRIFNTYKKYLDIHSFSNDNNNVTYSIGYLSKKANKLCSILGTDKQLKFRYKYYQNFSDDINAINLYNEFIELPQYWGLTELQIKQLADKIKIIEGI